MTKRKNGGVDGDLFDRLTSPFLALHDFREAGIQPGFFFDKIGDLTRPLRGRLGQALRLLQLLPNLLIFNCQRRRAQNARDFLLARSHGSDFFHCLHRRCPPAQRRCKRPVGKPVCRSQPASISIRQAAA